MVVVAQAGGARPLQQGPCAAEEEEGIVQLLRVCVMQGVWKMASSRTEC